LAPLQGPLDQEAEHFVDLAQPAQRGRQQQPHESPVPRIEFGEAPMLRQHVVQRLAPVEAGRQDLEGDAP
jgi:hypothetical protein